MCRITCRMMGTFDPLWYIVYGIYFHFHFTVTPCCVKEFSRLPSKLDFMASNVKNAKQKPEQAIKGPSPKLLLVAKLQTDAATVATSGDWLELLETKTELKGEWIMDKEQETQLHMKAPFLLPCSLCRLERGSYVSVEISPCFYLPRDPPPRKSVNMFFNLIQ